TVRLRSFSPRRTSHGSANRGGEGGSLNRRSAASTRHQSALRRARGFETSRRKCGIATFRLSQQILAIKIQCRHERKTTSAGAFSRPAPVSAILIEQRAAVGRVRLYPCSVQPDSRVAAVQKATFTLAA